METIAKKKYQDLLQRSFMRTLDLFLLKVILEDIDYETVSKKTNKVNFEEFIQFMKSSLPEKYKLIEQDRKSRQCCKGKETFENLEIKEIDKIFDRWYPENKNNIKKEYQTVYTQYFIPEVEFLEFYGNENSRKCKYCEITEAEIKRLFKNNQIKTKRWSTRGKYMEVDRIDPNGEYKTGNMALSCYWCNNAKTDEFSANEFKLIGDAIKNVWKTRLEKATKP